MFQTNNVKNINNFINIFDLLFHEEYVRVNPCANSATLQKNCKNCLFSSHRALRIFLEFFINLLVLHFLIFTNIRKYNIKKFRKNSKSSIRKK